MIKEITVWQVKIKMAYQKPEEITLQAGETISIVGQPAAAKPFNY